MFSSDYIITSIDTSISLLNPQCKTLRHLTAISIKNREVDSHKHKPSAHCHKLRHMQHCQAHAHDHNREQHGYAKSKCHCLLAHCQRPAHADALAYGVLFICAILKDLHDSFLALTGSAHWLGLTPTASSLLQDTYSHTASLNGVDHSLMFNNISHCFKHCLRKKRTLMNWLFMVSICNIHIANLTCKSSEIIQIKERIIEKKAHCRKRFTQKSWNDKLKP